MATNAPSLLAAFCDELCQQFRVHTILLYGSRANGTEGPDSDFDMAAFGPVEQGVRDARVVKGHFLDAFVYPERVLRAPSEEHLRLRGSRILLQREDEATGFLQALDRIHTKGPACLPQDELAARKAWTQKMCVRIERGDIEGNFSRAWLLTALLEDYFHLRGLWYEGPKCSFQWLERHDPRTMAAFVLALAPGASVDAIRALAEAVARDSPSSG